MITLISVGIDIGKENSVFCVLKPYGEIVQSPKELMHTQEALEELVRFIRSQSEEVKVIVEATGHYHLPILQYLLEEGIFICVVNPLVMKRYASVSIRKGKTDKMDALKIANYGIDHWFKLVGYEASGEIYREMNILSRQYNQYVSMKIKAKNILNNLLDQCMPGITKLLVNSSTNVKKQKLNDFVEKYVHYDWITKKSEKQFINSYLAWAKKEGYHQKESKAQEIYALAKGSIPTMPSNALSTELLVLEAVRVLREVEATLNKILTQMHELSKQLREYEVVRAMGGVGDKLVVRLIAEVGDVRRFNNASGLVAYTGIDAPPYQSGRFNGTERKISKRGNKHLRKVGYEVMQSIKKVKPVEDKAVYEYILKKEKEGKSKKVAKIAGLNKFLRIYYSRVMELYKE